MIQLTVDHRNNIEMRYNEYGGDILRLWMKVEDKVDECCSRV